MPEPRLSGLTSEWGGDILCQEEMEPDPLDWGQALAED